MLVEPVWKGRNVRISVSCSLTVRLIEQAPTKICLSRSDGLRNFSSEALIAAELNAMATKSPSQTRSSQQKHHLRKTLRPSNEAENVKEVYILVMGLTGAGKSTFISIVTGDDSIPIGKDDELDCGGFISEKRFCRDTS